MYRSSRTFPSTLYSCRSVMMSVLRYVHTELALQVMPCHYVFGRPSILHIRAQEFETSQTTAPSKTMNLSLVNKTIDQGRLHEEMYCTLQRERKWWWSSSLQFFHSIVKYVGSECYSSQLSSKFICMLRTAKNLKIYN